MKALKILLISDTKPGHVTQSEGLVNVLEKHFLVEKQLIEIKPKIKIANRFFRYLLNIKSNFTERFLNSFYKLDSVSIKAFQPDLIISTGGDTCGANVFLAKKYQCKNIFLGSLRKHHASLFSAIITTVAMPNVKNSIVLDIAPTLINLDKLQPSGEQFVSKHQIKNERLWVMLIGGEGSGYEFQQNNFKTIADAMLALAKKHSIRWLLTTSRRTGIKDEGFLKSLLQEKNEIAYAVYYNERPEKIMSAYLGAGEVIFCTEDSTSMVSEAVITQKKVVTLRANCKDINSGHLAVIQRFAKQKYIQRAKIGELEQINLDRFDHKTVDIQKNYQQIIDVIEQ